MSARAAVRAAFIWMSCLVALPAHGACVFNLQTNVSFGTYDIFAIGDTDTGVGSVRVRCTPGAPYTIKISTGGGGSYAPRVLTSGANTLNYNLYYDVGRTQIWGDGSGGTTFWTVASHSGNRTYSIYGRIPAGQDPAAGAYADTVTVTMDY